MPRIYLSAGEASGDAHAAELAKALKARAGDIEIFGMGGVACASAGVEIIQPIDDIAVMGFAEVIFRLGTIARAFKNVIETCRDSRPDVAVLVDYPAFHLRLAAKLRELGIPVVIYVAPQVWAWKEGRKYTVAELATKLLVVFEFEVDVFRPCGADVEFVGHPLLDEIDLEAPGGAARKELGIDAAAPLIAIMPGSRRQVRRRLLPVYLETAEAIRTAHPEVAVAIGTPDGSLGEWAAEADIPFPAVKQHDLLRDATAGMFNSGTISLEAAIFGCPGVIGYKVSWFNYEIGKRLVTLPCVGLPNIISLFSTGEIPFPSGGEPLPPERLVMKEFIQHDLRPAVVTVEMIDLLTDPARREAAVARLKEVREKLGPPGASGRAAEAVLRLL